MQELIKFSPAQVATRRLPDITPQRAFPSGRVSVSDIIDRSMPTPRAMPVIAADAVPVDIEGVMSAPAQVLGGDDGPLIGLLVAVLPAGKVLKVIAEPAAFRLSSDLRPGDKLRVTGLANPTPGPIIANDITNVAGAEDEPVNFARMLAQRKAARVPQD